jgi:hypothetical protein
MARFAQVDNGVVSATLDNRPSVVPQNRAFYDITDLPDVQCGWEYDRIQGVFVPPQIVSAQPVLTLEDVQLNLSTQLAPLGKLQDDVQKILVRLGG